MVDILSVHTHTNLDISSGKAHVVALGVAPKMNPKGVTCMINNKEYTLKFHSISAQRITPLTKHPGEGRKLILSGIVTTRAIPMKRHTKCSSLGTIHKINMIKATLEKRKILTTEKASLGYFKKEECRGRTYISFFTHP
mmetsp:Transcript_12048/g.18483  ORF Transcript_12048/g.18483 Transcript_12048/m.18483 type:complete len:139 (-) Transcript_12048:145-561(-)